MAGRQDIQAGRAYVSLYVNDSGLVKGLQRASAKLQSFGTKIAGLGKIMSIAGGAMAAPLIYAVKAASDMEETMNKFNVVFGDSAVAVKKWSDDFAASVGRSKQQAADFMASMQDLFVPLGFSADAAQSLSKQVTALAVDLASFNNMQDADTIRDLQAALTGSGEVMKKYGVIVSEAVVKQELLNQGLDPKRVTEQQKVQARLNIIMRGTTAAQGDAIRSIGGWANQMKKLRGSISDTAVAIGTALLPVVTPIITKAAEMVAVLQQWAEANTGLFRTIAAGIAGVVAAGVVLTGLGLTLTVLGVALGGIAGVFGAILSPIGLVVASITAGTAAFVTFTDTGQNALANLQNSFVSAGAVVKEAIGGIADALSAGDIGLAGQIAMAGLEVAFLDATKGIRATWHGFIKGLVDTFAVAAKFIVTAFQKAMTHIQMALAVYKSQNQEDAMKSALDSLESRKGSMSKRDYLVEKARIQEEGAANMLAPLRDADSAIAKLTETTDAWNLSLDDTLAGSQTAADEAISAANARMDSLKSEMTELRRVAKEKADAAKAEKEATAAAMSAAGAVAPASAASGTSGAASAATFSAAALSALGQGGGPMSQLAKTAEEHRKIAAEQLKSQRMVEKYVQNFQVATIS